MQAHKPEPVQKPTISAVSSRRPRLIAMLVLLGVAMAVLFLTIQNRIRTRQSLEAWQNLRAELEAKGESLDWKDFIPPEVPDELNLYKAPGMQARFSRLRSQTNRVPVISLPGWVSEIPLSLDQIRDMPETVKDESSALTSTASRQRLREWFAQQEAEYQLLVEASARPQVRFDADYTNLTGIWMREMDRPNFVNLRNAAQALVTHANLNLIDGKPDVAINDLFMLRRMADLSGSSPFLVGAMVRVAILGLYADTVRDAIDSGLLEDAHITSIQRHIRDVNVLDDLALSWRAERSMQVYLLTLEPEEVLLIFQPLLGRPAKPFWRYSLDDWNSWWNNRQLKRDITSPARMTDNLILICQLNQEVLDQLDVTSGRIHAAESSLVFSNMIETLQQNAVEYRLAAIAIPNISKAVLTTTQSQTQLNQLSVACALERHRLAHGSYPETLNALLPDFLDRIPNDLFADQPLQYRLNPDGSYDLWSVGWDEKDDGGQPILDKDGKPSYDEQQGDWVWSSPKLQTK